MPGEAQKQGSGGQKEAMLHVDPGQHELLSETTLGGPNMYRHTDQ